MGDRTHRIPVASSIQGWRPGCLGLLIVGMVLWAGGGNLQAQQGETPNETPRPAGAAVMSTSVVAGAPALPPAPSQPTPPPAEANPPSQPINVPPATFVPPAIAPPAPVPAPAVPRFQFPIAPNTPLKDLLPVPPKGQKNPGPMVEDLGQVSEVELAARPGKEVPVEEATKNTAHQIAKINHLNGKKTDGFVEALREDRADLKGLPFAMGGACRSKGDRSKDFAQAVGTIRRVIQQSPPPAAAMAMPGGTGASTMTLHRFRRAPVANVASTTPIAQDLEVLMVTQVPVVESGHPTENFWEQYQAACAQEDKALSREDRACQENITVARIAALMQILAAESPSVRLGLVRYLSGVSHVEATRALARLAVYSPEEEVRRAAIDALKVRRERDYTEILLQGLRYPWPAVARHAAEAVVKLERTDLIPQFVKVLEEPDPRAPVVKEFNGKEVAVVRELVRINHHRNCLLCHSPGNTGSVAPTTLTAACPIPGAPLPSPGEGYQTNNPDLTVRIDVTYLREDFSVLEAVEDANPWPEMQRFDFLVRTREVTKDEAAAYRDKLESRGAGQPSPYQRVALAALRDLTGKDTAPTAAAWRKILGPEMLRR